MENEVKMQFDEKPLQEMGPNTQNTPDAKWWVTPLLFAIKAIIILAAIIIVATQWKWENNTGGNLGLVIGMGILCLPVMIALDIIAIFKRTKSWQIALVMASMIIDILIVILMPEIMKLFH